MFGIPRQRVWVAALISLLLLLLLIAAAEGVTRILGDRHCHATAAECPEQRVGLVLGCSKLVGRWENRFFTGRVQAAAELWHAGKLSAIIVSGDNRTKYYNEPRDLKESLIALGVPAEVIVEDFAGLCTYDSVVRAKEIFGAEHLLIISQREHVARAVAIGRCLGIDAEGYCASALPLNRAATVRFRARECAARVAMLFDLLIQRTPTHMGDRIPLPQLPPPAAS